MPQYRTQGKIIADILTTARDLNQDGQGVGITTLLRRGNVSYTRMTKLIVDLVGAGLLLQETLEKEPKYRIRDKGKMYFQTYVKFADFAKSSGLRP